MKNVQTMPTGQLVEEYRSLLLTLGKNNDQKLAREADAYEEEILRRMAW